MPCIIAFIVLGIMSLFSATHRALAKEAFDCVFRRITFRPCNTGFQEKIKASFTARFVDRTPKLARFINKQFELLAWIFMLVTVASLGWVIFGLYNFYLYGSCNGLNDTGLCLLDITGANNQVSTCPSPHVADPEAVTLADVDLSLFPIIDRGGSKTVVFLGCVNCQYSRQVYELVKQIAADKKANFIFAHYPIKTETTYLTGLLNCAYNLDQENYWLLVSQLFAHETAHNASQEAILTEAQALGYDQNQLDFCLNADETASIAAQLHQEMEKTNLYGTPVVFINDEVLIGPKPKRVYQRALR
jgi:hypothetical protein